MLSLAANSSLLTLVIMQLLILKSLALRVCTTFLIQKLLHNHLLKIHKLYIVLYDLTFAFI